MNDLISTNYECDTSLYFSIALFTEWFHTIVITCSEWIDPLGLIHAGSLMISCKILAYNMRQIIFAAAELQFFATLFAEGVLLKAL